MSGFHNVEIEIVNVVASVDINQPLDLPSIVTKVKNANYTPKRFPGIVMRQTKPKSVILLFRTGKMVCTGTKSKESAHIAVHNAIRELKANGIVIHGEPRIVIQNMVASANLQSRVDIETLFDLSDNAMYEPEQFPGLIYRMKVPKTVLLLFSSGKLVCAGAKSERMVNESIKKMYEILQDYDLLFKK